MKSDLEARQALMKQRQSEPAPERKPMVKSSADPARTVVCRCGTSFVTVSASVRWCVPCRNNGHSGGRNKITAKLIARRRRALKLNAAGSHTEAEWKEVLKLQDYKCYYCGRELNPQNQTRDHVKALSKGGSDDIHNIVAACRKCNAQKHTRSAASFFEYLAIKRIQKQKKGQAISVEEDLELLSKQQDEVVEKLWRIASGGCG